ncbi:hypothetical protein EON79_03340 [bacterium]|nr:MAG: hypothetical protein EON79_03340 [bacterium]
MRPAAVASLAFASVWASACINDRDTVASELRQSPEVGRSLVGWFDRLPEDYYRQRINRLNAKGALTPNEYDDLSVAYERMGRSKEALEVIEKKAKLPLKGEDLYRLHANRGTFLLILWLKGGAKIEDMSLVERGERDITTAVRLKPGSHFGRESTQLELMRWLIAAKKQPEKAGGLGQWLAEHTTEAQRNETQPSHSKGLAGLISLGAAWEMVDVAAALAYLESLKRHYQMAEFARMRVDELRKSGKRAFNPSGVEEDMYALATEDPGARHTYTAECYLLLRTAADERNAALTTFVENRIDDHRHPDTEPSFWKAWEEPALPKLPGRPSPFTPAVQNVFVPVLVGGAGVLIVSAILLDRRRRGRRASASGMAGKNA